MTKSSRKPEVTDLSVIPFCCVTISQGWPLYAHFKKEIKTYVCAYECFVCMYAGIAHACLVLSEVRRCQVPLELESQMVAGHCMGAGTKPKSPTRVADALNH